MRAVAAGYLRSFAWLAKRAVDGDHNVNKLGVENISAAPKRCYARADWFCGGGINALDLLLAFATRVVPHSDRLLMSSKWGTL